MKLTEINGRDLDVIVAEEVMGWQPLGDPPDDYHPELWESNHRHSRKRPASSADPDVVATVPAYSHDMPCALHVWEHLQAQEGAEEGTITWRKSAERGTRYNVRYVNDGYLYDDVSSNPALSICLVALDWVHGRHVGRE